jgi:hypothetical protein
MAASIPLKQFSEQLRAFWGNTIPSGEYFSAKVALQRAGETAIRVFGTEISKGDMYLELTDFDQNFLETTHRTLFRIPYHSDWETRYTRISDTKGPDIQIPYNAMQAIERVSLEDPRTTPATATADLYQGDDAEMDMRDMNYSGMTMRDFYCVTQNVPLSNKGWLNNLIRQGIAWKEKRSA